MWFYVPAISAITTLINEKDNFFLIEKYYVYAFYLIVYSFIDLSELLIRLSTTFYWIFIFHFIRIFSYLPKGLNLDLRDSGNLHHP